MASTDAGSRPGDEVTVEGLIDDIGRGAAELSPGEPAALYAGVARLAASVDRLRRVARTARDAAADDNHGYGEPGVGPPELALPEAAFAALTETHRRAVLVHCYRMTGSYDDAEDLVRETFLRAWRARDTFRAGASVRTWLYRIATNACLDLLRRTARRPHDYEPLPGTSGHAGEPPARVTWLQPYPDDELPEADQDPGVPYGTLELPLLVALQHLPPRQRAALILRDVLGLSPGETAETLDLTPVSVDGALRRARPALRDLLSDGRTRESPETEAAVLARYTAAVAALDLAALGGLLADDVLFTAPPNPSWCRGRDAVLAFLRPGVDAASPAFPGHRRHLPTRANGQPAAGGYLRRPGTNVHRAQALDVLRVEGGRIVEITSFEPHLLPAFGLPLRL
ncbi:RNA polymerase subunit sigma-70 [Streptomyces phaeoluteigriseus]|uniref:RNA polymerase subunit sigma-70 n=1 Tax=Streptomyces phaeoluteigriseus TaxID=114686 RepID=UPI0036CB74EB